MAVNCWVCPAAIEAVTGETPMLTSTAGVTVRAAVPKMSPEVAVMVVAPVATPVASPELETVAVPVRDEVQVTVDVRSWVLPPKKCPVAVNCCVRPTAMEAVPGDTLMLKSVSACDCSIVSPSTVPIAAPITTNMVMAVRTIRLEARLSRLNTASPFPHLRRGPLNDISGAPTAPSPVRPTLKPGGRPQTNLLDIEHLHGSRSDGGTTRGIPGDFT